ncbi:uncharacterized protein LOC131691470 [Topomyia yanbarensis]|uniref:uncharacterized protein LOC131691470 n=1 Tax=Topomyia yanbarensis TaxID=2498891 RepID=UPI00273C253B|nr:uncharacterized protein LOC131691470 [Topomyia yanbarensis]
MESHGQDFKILHEIRNLGCDNECLCAAAYRLYLHLCEDRYLWNVQYHYSQKLDLIYLTARKQKDSPSEDVYIPVASFDELPMTSIERYQAELAHPDKNGNRCIVLAFCDPSSSVLLYRMTNAIVPLSDKPMSKNKLNKLKALASTSQNKSD